MSRLSSFWIISGILLVVALAVRSFPEDIPLDYRSVEMIEDHDARCRQCDPSEDCFRPPEGCHFGTYRDRCGHVNCYRGLEDACNDSTRLCNPTMRCRCGICTGCGYHYLRPSDYNCSYPFCLEASHRRPRSIH